MRIESSVTSVSWILSEGIRGLPKAPFELGVTHYDEPPPDSIDDLEALHARGAFRFANRLAGWVEVRDGRIVDAGHAGRSYISTTQARVGSKASVVFQPLPFPDLVRAPEVSETAVRFVQTAGGRPGIPAPRRVRRKPYVQWVGPIVWSTLALTIHVDGEKVGELGPGAIVGERSVLEGGTRTVTLRAVCDVRVAVAGPDDVDPDALARLAEGHPREDG